MAMEKICTVEDVWEGEMDAFEVTDGREVLVACLDGGDWRAFQAICPHQETALVEGTLEGTTLTCRAHLWQFDLVTGRGVNPSDSRLADYPVEVDGEDVLVDVAGIEPYYSHT